MGLKKYLRMMFTMPTGNDVEDGPTFRCIRCGQTFERQYDTCKECGASFVVEYEE